MYQNYLQGLLKQIVWPQPQSFLGHADTLRTTCCKHWGFFGLKLLPKANLIILSSITYIFFNSLFFFFLTQFQETNMKHSVVGGFCLFLRVSFCSLLGKRSFTQFSFLKRQNKDHLQFKFFGTEQTSVYSVLKSILFLIIRKKKILYLVVSYFKNYCMCTIYYQKVSDIIHSFLSNFITFTVCTFGVFSLYFLYTFHLLCMVMSIQLVDRCIVNSEI